ncbi:HDOD domain-containing protein [Methyloterricola oryzae]|uniref:HDOD domain-containing protein n=1 Tax=Methyloterricola oryzae TaxID=1495050 RepID=UPI0011AF65CF|nr:HDOD domain-containing protein [Methyloterricola oryzae]
MNSSSRAVANGVPATEILAGVGDLPSLPAVLMDALAHLDDQSAAATQLVEKIGQDPPLSARLLRVANSPFFGMPRQIASLREALILVGIDRIRELVVSACFPRVIPFENGSFQPAEFWCRSLVVATCARTIAGHAGISKEAAFTAGLLHDIGHLVLGCRFQEWYARILTFQSKNNVSLIEAERHVIGMDHMTLGEQVAERWNFPIAIKNAIRSHHERPTRETAMSLNAVVYLANVIGDELERDQLPEALHSEDYRYALEMMDLAGAEADALNELARSSCAQLQSLLWP